MPRGVCMGCAIQALRCNKRVSAPDGAGCFGGGADFFGNFIRLIGIKIHGDLGAASLNKEPHHTRIGGADLQVRFYIAFGVDAHDALMHETGTRASPAGIDWQAALVSGLPMTDLHLRPFRPSDIDWLVDQHATNYALNDGFDDSFGPLVRDILDGFVTSHDPARERGWIAERAGQPLGSIFCVSLSEDTAKLRLFFLMPKARGQGLGKRLLQTCMQFAREAGYTRMQLWTHESHEAACALYKASGWRLVSSKPVHSFGQDLVEQSWDIAL